MDEQLDLFSEKQKLQVAITGASGMIGSFLEKFLQEKGHTVFSVPRKALESKDRLEQILRPVDVVINLAGENIGEGRWTAIKKRRIWESRVHATRNIVSVLNKESIPPKVYISTSAAGYYGREAQSVDSEDCPPGNDFLAKVCVDLEAEAKKYAKGRLVIARLGVVLSKKGGFLQKMLTLGKYCLLGKIGSGRGHISFITIEDLAKIFLWCIEEKTLHGAINVTAPSSITNNDLTKAITRHLHRPQFLPIPAFLVKLFFGEKGELLLLADQSVYPKRLIDEKYSYEYVTVEEYLETLAKRL